MILLWRHESTYLAASCRRCANHSAMKSDGGIVRSQWKVLWCHHQTHSMPYTGNLGTFLHTWPVSHVVIQKCFFLRFLPILRSKQLINTAVMVVDWHSGVDLYFKFQGTTSKLSETPSWWNLTASLRTYHPCSQALERSRRGAPALFTHVWAVPLLCWCNSSTYVS